MKYCPECGAGLERHRVAGELRGHWFCQACGVPRHDHPMVVVTCFVTCGKRLLWVKRDLEPKRGLWAIPGGYLESGETLAEGAARELAEEAGVVLPPERLEVRRISGAGHFLLWERPGIVRDALLDRLPPPTGAGAQPSR